MLSTAVKQKNAGMKISGWQSNEPVSKEQEQAKLVLLLHAVSMLCVHALLPLLTVHTFSYNACCVSTLD